MHRFIVDPKSIHNGHLRIYGDDLKHLRKVLRLGPGDSINVFDGTGKEFEAKLLSVDKTCALAEITASFQTEAEPEINLTLFQGLLKGEKMDLIIQKGVELGVRSIIPVITDRTVVQVDNNKSEKKALRWSKIAREASKQCRRAMVPHISEPISFDEAISESKRYEAALLLYENESKKCLKETLKCYTINKIKEIALFVGPEGGFTPHEIEKYTNSGFDVAGLGRRILRAETAAISVISIIMYEMGELN
ncbi:MAG: 16S rRNA (uracil(1498)-N(3))-methyltransferase [Acetivibrionales bacterium]